MTRDRRLGVLGGTFDPIHHGHLDAAAAACRALALDEVIFVPASTPPHRHVAPRAPAFHRFAMAAIAINHVEQYRVSDMELTRSGPSYTALTLADLHRQGWSPTQIFFIIGSDAFADIATWHDYPRILEACHYAVIARPGVSLDHALAAAPLVRARLATAADVGSTSGTGVFRVDTVTVPVSSTVVRTRLARGEPLDGLVPVAVAAHIRRHHLYEAAGHLHGQD